MSSAQQQQLIQAYISAYNNMDVDAMLAPLHPAIVFTNVSNGEVTHTTQGKTAFKVQAEQALNYFSQRCQTVTGLTWNGEQAEALIDYKATLAIELPNGLKAGQELHLQGKSVFRFSEGLISIIEDIS